MEHMERKKIDRGFVKEQIPLTKTMKELAEKCGCSENKLRHFIIDNGLYKYYCEAHNIPYDPSKEENRICSVCGYDKYVQLLKGIPYCKRCYNQMYRYGRIEKTIHTRNDIIIEGDIAKIILLDKYQNVKGETLIDAEDVDKVKNLKWYIGSGGYCVTKGIEDTNTGIDISNVIFNDYENKYDHISHNRLDNRKVNLRIITDHQNAMNMGKKNTNTSGVTGVSQQKQKRVWTGRWVATLVYNYKNIWLGSYATFDEAVHARLKGEIEYFGEYSPNYDPETKTIQLKYTNPDTNIKHYVEYSLGGELLHDDQIAA